MTDNDIIKALECHVRAIENLKNTCIDCQLYGCVSNCSHVLARHTFDLINRQKAEIERYKGVIKILENDVKTARAEAIKEFGHFLIDNAEGSYIHALDISDYVIEKTSN